MTAHRDQWEIDSAARVYAEVWRIADLTRAIGEGPPDGLFDFLRSLEIVCGEAAHTDTELQDARDYLRRTLFEWDGQV